MDDPDRTHRADDKQSADAAKARPLFGDRTSADCGAPVMACSHRGVAAGATEDPKSLGGYSPACGSRFAGQSGLPGKAENLIGRRFGRWLVHSYFGKTQNCRVTWICVCDCGSQGTATSLELKRGDARSCGCLRREMTGSRFAAGLAHTHAQDENLSEYRTYNGMRTRCLNNRSDNFRKYGALGVTVCDRWKNGADGKSGFDLFFEDMGKKPTARHSIDRIDPFGNYEPGNCRWATSVEQANNKRRHHSPRSI